MPPTTAFERHAHPRDFADSFAPHQKHQSRPLFRPHDDASLDTGKPADDAQPSVTFTAFVEIAHNKNTQLLARADRSLCTSLLQRNLWQSLQDAFTVASDKVALVNAPIEHV